MSSVAEVVETTVAEADVTATASVVAKSRRYYHYNKKDVSFTAHLFLFYSFIELAKLSKYFFETGIGVVPGWSRSIT